MREVAERFAWALDQDDLDHAFRLLVPDCEYHTGQEVLHGAEAVIRPYAETGRKVKELFDKVEYRSEFEGDEDGSSSILFVDWISKNGRSHEFRCRQKFRVNELGKITHIEHCEIPGEREKLRSFFQDVGVNW